LSAPAAGEPGDELLAGGPLGQIGYGPFGTERGMPVLVHHQPIAPSCTRINDHDTSVRLSVAWYSAIDRDQVA
jgi:hypothetical protein